MGGRRLELLHLAALDPKSSASTNFATRPSDVNIASIENKFSFYSLGSLALRIPINLPQPKPCVKSNLPYFFYLAIIQIW